MDSTLTWDRGLSIDGRSLNEESCILQVSESHYDFDRYHCIYFKSIDGNLIETVVELRVRNQVDIARLEGCLNSYHFMGNFDFLDNKSSTSVRLQL